MAAAPGTARAEPRSAASVVYTLQVARADGTTTFASAFVVRDPRPEHAGGLLLVTALHAIGHASSIQILLESCPPSSKPLLAPFSATNGLEVLVWRTLDVAALVIPSDRSDQILLDRAVLKDLGPRPPPRRGDRVWIIGTGGSSACAPVEEHMVTDGRDELTAEWLFRSLTKANPRIYWTDVMGSLANGAKLIEYSPATQSGTSGAAVTFPDSPAVFAVHLGGDSARSGWGVIVDVDTLQATMCSPANPAGCAYLDARHPTLEIDDFQEPNFGRFDPQTLAANDIQRHGLSVSGGVESTTPVDPFGAWSVTPEIGISRELWSPPFAPLAAAIALRAEGGPTFGQYRSPLRMRDGSEESPLQGQAKLPFLGALGTLGLDVHLARVSPLQYVAGIGLRAAYVHQPDVPDRAESFTWGPEIRAGVRWRLVPRIWAWVRLSFTYESIPVAATPIGCVGPSLPRDSVWDLWGGGGAGLELEP